MESDASVVRIVVSVPLAVDVTNNRLRNKNAPAIAGAFSCADILSPFLSYI